MVSTKKAQAHKSLLDELDTLQKRVHEAMYRAEEISSMLVSLGAYDHSAELDSIVTELDSIWNRVDDMYKEFEQYV